MKDKNGLLAFIPYPLDFPFLAFPLRNAAAFSCFLVGSANVF